MNTSDYLAAERTFLAWIRTGLALMGFGFVVARFGLFLQALRIDTPDSTARASSFSPWFGTVLIVLGIIVMAWCAWGHARLVSDWKRSQAVVPRPSRLLTIVSLVLAALGLAMAIYLISLNATRPEQTAAPRAEVGLF
jgi:putative membrane protein